MTVRSEEEVELLMRPALASLAVEGDRLNKKQKLLVKKCLTGEISHEEFVKQALELARHA
ncbi:hypothetical protein [Halobacillus sp. Nhm2S1]|uniref:hypothetical protein n=1 Tax=Halobacillus sp. Nhm2S1 TaxID=2866716 RepID=UPI001C73A7F2|nr:hypothetical protein [Halobacillus sp. Nhm2S1]MBX0358117.1 hypothetical protein [Halobacillus sp. Nhm2S1]